MVVKFYKNNSDERCLRKDLTPLAVASTIAPVPEAEIIPRVTAPSPNISASSYGGWSGTDWLPYGAFTTDVIVNWSVPATGSCWTASDTDNNPWIMYEFDELKYITSIVIKCGSSYSGTYTANITIEGSVDGLTWDELATGVITGELQNITTNTYTSSDTTTLFRYMRITFDAPTYVPYSPSLYIESIDAAGGHMDQVDSYDLPIEFKQDESRLNPSLILQHNVNIEGANYCSINSRYYYITEITYSQQRIILTLHEDVLMSHASDILKLGVIVDRQSYEGNPYLKDMEMPVEAKRNVQVKIFPYGFSGDTYILATNGA